MGQYGTGQSVTRTEDHRFLTGTGRYTDDISFPGQAYLYLFRSPYAHGVITELKVSDARSAPGVIALYTAEDLTAAGVNDLAGASIEASLRTEAKEALRQRPLARGRVRYVGEPVVGIVAESLAEARDAADLIWFDVEELGAAISPTGALQSGAAQIHAEVPGNLYGILEYGNRRATEDAFAAAEKIVEIEVVNNRVAPSALEPRGCNALFGDRMLTLYQGSQGVHLLRDRLAQSIDIDAEHIHVISPDVGGGFGLKYFLQCETVVAAHAAMATSRPVKWTADRNESFLADTHGRDHVSHASIAMDRNGKILAMRATVNAAIGAYCSQAGPAIPWFGACMTPGCYDIENVYVDVHTVITNTVPVDAYRGAGRPEAAYLIERLINKAAKKLDLSPDEMRRRNFIRPEQFPYITATGKSYDSGEYENLMESAMHRADWAGFENRRTESATRGRLRGIGMAYYVEICSALGHESAHVRVEKDGRITALLGTQATGQGHETTFAQIVAGTLGIDIETIDVIEGDTAKVPGGFGTVGSRSMAIGGSSLVLSLSAMIEAGRRTAATLLGAPLSNVEFESGYFHVAGMGQSLTLADVARASYDDEQRPVDVRPGLASSERFTPDAGTFPNGCHICELEIDPETGVAEIARYTVEDDVGVVINPLLLEGQIAGGVAQGLGQACGEHAIYEPDSGQLLTASFMDYPMPRADWIPDVDFNYREIPSPRNPLGVKGAGEAGTVGAAPAYINAVIDALSVRGIEHIDMPATPLKIWELLNGS